MSFAKLGFVSTTLVAAMVAKSPANADTKLDASTVIRITVKYGDLDLRAQSGAETLVTRISHAAKRVCGARSLIGPGAHQKQERRAVCMREADASAIATVNHPIVTAVYAQKRGTIAATVATR